MDHDHSARPDEASLPGPLRVQRMPNGWLRLDDSREGPAGVDIVLIQPGRGVALLEFAPAWAPDAVDRLRDFLDAAGFTAAHSGHLPVIHRKLRHEDEPDLASLLSDAFDWQEPISLSGRGAWEAELVGLLAVPKASVAESQRAPLRRIVQIPRAEFPGTPIAPVARPPEDLSRPAFAPARPAQPAAPPPGPVFAPSSFVEEWPTPDAPRAAEPVRAETPLRPASAEGPMPVPPVPIPATKLPPAKVARAVPQPVQRPSLSRPRTATVQPELDVGNRGPARGIGLIALALIAVLGAAVGGLIYTLRDDAPVSREASGPLAPKAPVLASAIPQPPVVPAPEPAPAAIAPVPAEPVRPLPTLTALDRPPAARPPQPAAAEPARQPVPVEEPAARPASEATASISLPTSQPPATAPQIAMAAAPVPPPPAAVPAPPAPPMAALAPASAAREAPARPEPAARLPEGPLVAEAAPSAIPFTDAPAVERRVVAARPMEPVPQAEPARAPALLTLPPEVTERVIAPARSLPEPAPRPAPPAASEPSRPALEPEPAQVAALRQPPPVPSEPPPILAAMLRRGEALLATGDISGARRFFERGASLGSSAAARAMAETFDPATLANRNTRGLQPDPVQAVQWYRRAEELGATDLAPRISRLEAAR